MASEEPTEPTLPAEGQEEDLTKPPPAVGNRWKKAVSKFLFLRSSDNDDDVDFAVSPGWQERRLRLALRRHGGGLKDDVVKLIAAEDVEEKGDEDSVDFGLRSGLLRQKPSFYNYVKEAARYVGRLRLPAPAPPASPSRSFPPKPLQPKEEPPPPTDDIVDHRPRQQLHPPPVWPPELTDNTDRRIYGVGVVGELLQREIRPHVLRRPYVVDQMDDLSDYRPYFTYWASTVQLIVMLIALIAYGVAPVSVGLAQTSGLVMTEWLTLEQVDVLQPGNFWLGPRAHHLVRLGAKFSPCMRRIGEIADKVASERAAEAADTGCCIRNDRSGCVQTSSEHCSPLLSTFVKWNRTHPGPDGRTSGPVCGQDPFHCSAPFSSSWPDDIGRWPICAASSSSSSSQVSRIGAPDHMSCEPIAKPCCVGIHGRCELRSAEFCRWVQGTFHPEANLCSQVSCLGDVCGMLPFVDSSKPDQFYRLITSLFLHAGAGHLLITLVVQLYLMRDLEKMCGWLRLAIIYVSSGVVGNLASAVFVPYRAECGPAGSVFGVFGAFVVEVIKARPLLRRPNRALLELLGIMLVLLLLGAFPWVDNYAHAFGFLTGLLLSHALLPSIDFSRPSTQANSAASLFVTKHKRLISVATPLAAAGALFLLLLAVFYLAPLSDCPACRLLSCIPIFKDFCAEQNIDFASKGKSIL